MFHTGTSCLCEPCWNMSTCVCPRPTLYLKPPNGQLVPDPFSFSSPMTILYLLTPDPSGWTQGHILPIMLPCICPPMLAPHQILGDTSIALNRQRISGLHHYIRNRGGGHHQSSRLLKIILLSWTLNTFWVGLDSPEDTVGFLPWEKPVKCFKEKSHFSKTQGHDIQ